MINKGVLFAGLPQTGKTTYMAALWYYIFNSFSNEDYTVNNLANDEKEYLNARASEWASFEPVLRTSQGVIEQVTISMKKKTTQDIVQLNIPDISGEAFKRQFSAREWSLEFDEIIKNTNGILLFIDPMNERNIPKFIYNRNGYYKLFGENPPIPEEKEAWSTENVPDQVKLVDFLQTIDYHRPHSVSTVSVVVSCWDLVEKTPNPLEPKEWCKLNLPLLYQYLESNNTLFASKYFGVSAQGCDYETDSEIKTLREISPLERILVVEGKNKSNNILSPILWITDGNKN